MKNVHFFIPVSAAGIGQKIVFGCLILLSPILLSAQQYRSKGSGHWNSKASWQISSNGTNWTDATTHPTFNNSTLITIRNTHSITMNGNIDADQVVVESGAKLLVSSGVSFKLKSVKTPVFSLQVHGVVETSGSITNESGSIMLMENNSELIFNQDNGILPAAKWATTAKLTMNKWPSAGLDQELGHVVSKVAPSSFTGNTTVKGNFEVDMNTTFVMVPNSNSNNIQYITIEGNLIKKGSGGITLIRDKGNLALHVKGNMEVTGDLIGVNNQGELNIKVDGDMKITEKFTGQNSNNKIVLEVGGNLEVSKDFVGSQNNGDFTLKVGKNFYGNEKVVFAQGNGAASVEIGGDLFTGKEFVARQNQGDINVNVKGSILVGDKFTGTNGNGKVNLNVGGNFSGGNEVVLAQNNGDITFTVGGNFIAPKNNFIGSNGNSKLIMLVSGKFEQTSGSTSLMQNNGEVTVTVLKDFLFSGSSFHFTGSNSTKAVLNVAGHFSITKGTVQVNNGEAFINLNGNGDEQVYTSGATYSGKLHVTVKSGAFVQMAANGTQVAGTGNFIVEKGATLAIRSDRGVNVTGNNTGHILCTGKREYNKEADYIFNGIVAQRAGNGITEARNLTFNNLKGVVLDINMKINNTLNLLNGEVLTAQNKLIIVLNRAVSAINSSNNQSFITGPMQWYVAKSEEYYEFPVGKPGTKMAFKMLEVSGNGIFNGEYFKGTPPGQDKNKAYGFFADMLTGVLANEYWQIDRVGIEKTSARVILPYNPTEISKSWIGLDGKPITPKEDAKVSVVKGSGNGYSNWGFLNDYFSDKSIEGAPKAVEALSNKMDGEVISGVVNEFSPFSLGFGYFKILPITLLHFDGQLSNNTTVLNWTIANADEAGGFEVEHSTNGISFNKLAHITGNTNAAFQYRHNSPVAGINYYRLRMIDKAGAIQYSRTVAIAYGKAVTAIMGLQQNPVQGNSAILKLATEKPQSAQISLVDMAGRTVAQQSIQLNTGIQQYGINIQNLAPGTYRMLVFTNDGVKKVIPMVKL